MSARYPQLDDADWLRREFVDKHRTSADLGDEIGVDGRTVRYALRRHGIARLLPSRRRPMPPELDDADWLARKHAERSAASIARDLGVSHHALSNALRRAGIEPHPQGRARPGT